MTLLVCMGLAILPGLAWMGALFLWQREDPLVRRAMVRVGVLGGVVALPVVPVCVALEGLVVLGSGNPVLGRLALFMLVIAPVQEILKFLVIWSQVDRRWPFTRAGDAMGFASAAAIGFATVTSVMASTRSSMLAILLGATGRMIAHGGISAIFGHFIGLVRARRFKAAPVMAEGLFWATAFHGAFGFASALWPASLPIGVGVILAFAVLLRLGLFVPLLSLLAPRMVEPPAVEDPMKDFEGRRFPILEGSRDQDAVLRALESMQDLDPYARMDALAVAVGIRDERVFEAVKDLRHDPEEEVRRRAEEAFIEMKRILQTLSTGS